ncbi:MULTISPECIES: hypothetical protein [unclassified Coleofasciculus]|uniref:hypothetical protein n=1 Tax=unclassified Coleofasciculus TaxID=2692782 RepID=UPI00187F6C77|nr:MULTISPECIES: hypothetical protein [unclassified Coleofasciculus]MBE9125184.1 hypothetical protein [Coleofasciculus sp. LEGE 07081]MBE9148761.1 hypothetical protein [Coleofasciculus sp. LEGE 07092]
MDCDEKLLSIRLPDSLYQALIAYQKQQQLDSTAAAAVSILAEFLQQGEETKRYATIEQLEALSKKVDYLNYQVSALSHSRLGVSSTATPATGIHSPTQAVKRASPLTHPVVSTNLEDMDDEPDEILYEFL